MTGFHPLATSGLLLALLGCSKPAAPALDPGRDVGVARLDSTTGCAAFTRPDLPNGLSLTLLLVPVAGGTDTTEAAAARLGGQVPRNDPRCPPELGTGDDHLYEVRLEAAAPTLSGPLFAILAPRTAIRLQGPHAVVALGTAADSAAFRVCTSNEGLHMTLWSGPVSSPTRLFHSYFPLGYDVEPTCTEADWADSGP